MQYSPHDNKRLHCLPPTFMCGMEIWSMPVREFGRRLRRKIRKFGEKFGKKVGEKVES